MISGNGEVSGITGVPLLHLYQWFWLVLCVLTSGSSSTTHSVLLDITVESDFHSNMETHLLNGLLRSLNQLLTKTGLQSLFQTLSMRIATYITLYNGSWVFSNQKSSYQMQKSWLKWLLKPNKYLQKSKRRQRSSKKDSTWWKLSLRQNTTSSLLQSFLLMSDLT